METRELRYLGSKTSTTEQVYQRITGLIPRGSFCDPFGGVGIVGAFFKRRGFSVWSGDILRNAHYFQVARIQRNRRPSFRLLRKSLRLDSTAEVVQMLNEAHQKDGWFEREYSRKRQFFIAENAQRIAGCRLMIRSWTRDELVSEQEKAVLLASLVNSMDKVANTAGTYYAYLK